jgi:long-chain acyl-CoA synthetase
VEGYGLSEAPTALTCNPVQGHGRKGSIGLPLPDVDCRIISLEDSLTGLVPGKVGELIARSPQVMAKYHNQPAETRLALREGWLYTGDVAYMDSDGYFYLVDRKKDVIKVGRLQVWPREVEEAIASHPKVLEVGVAGINHPDYGETVKAWVVVKPGEILTAEEVMEWCKVKWADYKAPRVVKFIVQLPRITVGKVLRRELAKELGEPK